MGYRFHGFRNCLFERTGFGSFVYTNGDVYRGNWLYGVRHGVYSVKQSISLIYYFVLVSFKVTVYIYHAIMSINNDVRERNTHICPRRCLSRRVGV
jgi:hypothetical protein